MAIGRSPGFLLPEAGMLLRRRPPWTRRGQLGNVALRSGQGLPRKPRRNRQGRDRRLRPPRADRRRSAHRRRSASSSSPSISNSCCRPSIAPPPATKSGSPPASRSAARAAKAMPGSAICAAGSASACSASATRPRRDPRLARHPAPARCQARSRLVSEHRRRRATRTGRQHAPADHDRVPAAGPRLCGRAGRRTAPPP